MFVYVPVSVRVVSNLNFQELGEEKQQLEQLEQLWKSRLENECVKHVGVDGSTLGL